MGRAGAPLPSAATVFEVTAAFVAGGVVTASTPGGSEFGWSFKEFGMLALVDGSLLESRAGSGMAGWDLIKKKSHSKIVLMEITVIVQLSKSGEWFSSILELVKIFKLAFKDY